LIIGITKHHQMITKRMVTITIVFAKAKFWNRGRPTSHAFVVFPYYWLEFWLLNVGNGLPNVNGRPPNEWLQLRLFTQSAKPKFELGGGANFMRMSFFYIID